MIGDADVGNDERRCVVDPVADEKHPLAVFLQLADRGDLVFGQQSCTDSGRRPPTVGSPWESAPVLSSATTVAVPSRWARWS